VALVASEQLYRHNLKIFSLKGLVVVTLLAPWFTQAFGFVHAACSVSENQQLWLEVSSLQRWLMKTRMSSYEPVCR
jgi:hypothetical protein